MNLCGLEQESNRRPYSIATIVEAVVALRQTGHTLKGAVFSYRNPHSDFKYCRQFDAACTDAFSPQPYRHCEVFLGMHFHSVLLALQNGVPTIAISYSDKVRRLMREYDLDPYCLEPEDVDLARRLRALVVQVRSPIVMDKIRAGNQRARERLSPFEMKLTNLLSEATA